MIDNEEKERCASVLMGLITVWGGEKEGAQINTNTSDKSCKGEVWVPLTEGARTRSQVLML